MPAEVFERQLAVFEALRRIGFTSEELFVSYNGGVPVTLIRVGDKQFAVSTEGPCAPQSEPEYIEGWMKAAEWWNTTAAEGERMPLYHKYISHGTMLNLILALDDADMPLRAEGAQMVVGPKRN